MLTHLVTEINERRPRLHKYRRYYDGKQTVKFMGADLQADFGRQLQSLSCNRCETVVDSVLDRLTIVGFEDKDDTSNHEELARSYWQNQRMDRTAREVHQEALIHGDAYVLVWPNETVEVHSQHSDQFAVIYDDENPDKLYCAAKAWKLRDGKWRLNIYFEDRLEKYKSVRADQNLPEAEQLWEEYSDKEDASWPIPYAFGRVPVFHFAVNARSGEYGRSDLDAIIPLQDSLNRTLANQAVAEEFQSYKQRWATGIQPIEHIYTDENGVEHIEYLSPFQDGADRLWTTDNPDTKFGEFSSADLTMFEEVITGHEVRIARTARIPVHYLTGLGAVPSGEALKTTEAPFVSKIKDRQRSFGSTWDDVINFVLFLEHGIISNVQVVWQSPETRIEQQMIEHAVIKKSVGVSKAQVLRELGYSDTQIEEFEQENEDDLDSLTRAFNEA